jgi:hypothetical protein
MQVGNFLGTKQKRTYGVICYQGDFYNNLGDEIQSLAAIQYMHKIDYFIPIDQINTFRQSFFDRFSKKTKVILNGYYTCYSDRWPPSENIEPLLISFHISDYEYPGYRPAIESILSPPSLKYLERQQPIGCRDLVTMHRLQERGIDAYFSGCLTLTCKPKSLKKEDHICIVDVECDIMKLLNQIPEDLINNIRFRTHVLENAGKYSKSQRFSLAEKLLQEYESAALVITSRLHCALPCLAFGTPVLFILPKEDLSRLPGLVELLHSFSGEDIEKGNFKFSFESPNPNPGNIKHLVKRLRSECSSFINGT